MTTAIEIFDRRAVRRHRDRAAANLAAHDFLIREIAERLADRLADFTRPFPVTLELGCHTGQLRRQLADRGGIETLLQADISQAMARRADGARLVADEEFLPFAADSVDLVASVLSLHWVNDLPGTLIQTNRLLKPDGLFIAAIFGGETLHELRHSLLAAESEVEGGASPRVSPFTDVRDAGMLLQRAGFALPVVDADTITVSYPDPFALMREVRGMGESNAMVERRDGFSRRATLQAAARHYHDTFATADGRIPATFQVLYLTGWAPHESQQKPLAPGSASARLADALDAREQPAGDKAQPT